jgi:hypothetical protein
MQLAHRGPNFICQFEDTAVEVSFNSRDCLSGKAGLHQLNDATVREAMAPSGRNPCGASRFESSRLTEEHRQQVLGCVDVSQQPFRSPHLALSADSLNQCRERHQSLHQHVDGFAGIGCSDKLARDFHEESSEKSAEGFGDAVDCWADVAGGRHVQATRTALCLVLLVIAVLFLCVLLLWILLFCILLLCVLLLCILLLCILLLCVLLLCILLLCVLLLCILLLCILLLCILLLCAESLGPRSVLSLSFR